MSLVSSNENLQQSGNYITNSLCGLLNQVIGINKCSKTLSKKITCEKKEEPCVRKVRKSDISSCRCLKIYGYVYPTISNNTTLINSYPYYGPAYEKRKYQSEDIRISPYGNGGLFFEKGGNFLIRPTVKSVQWRTFPAQYVPNTINIILYVNGGGILTPATSYAIATIALPVFTPANPNLSNAKSYDPVFVLQPNASNPLSNSPLDIPPNSTYYFTLGISVNIGTPPPSNYVTDSLYTIVTLNDFNLEFIQI